MREGWDFTTIGEACEVVNGGTPKTTVADYWNGPHRWITPAEMGGLRSPYVTETARTLSDSGLDRSSVQLLPEQSIILSSRAPIGYVVINARPMSFNQGCKGLIPGERVDTKYLYYHLISNIDLLNRLGTGATFKELSGTKLKTVPLPLPPLPEQRRIVAILDEVFEGIDAAVSNAERNRANARELFESYLNRVFTEKGEGWVERQLGDLVSIKHGFAFKSDYFVDDGPYVLLTPGNFFEEGGYRDRGERQKFYDGPLPDEFVLSAGDMLIAMTEQAAGLLGSPLIVPNDGQFLHNQRLGLVEVRDNVPWISSFFFHAFNTQGFRRRVHDDASGVKVRHTSPKKLCSVKVAFPVEATRQVAIASLLDGLLDSSRRLESICTRKLAALEELKQSILQTAFSGELTPELAEEVQGAAECL